MSDPYAAKDSCGRPGWTHEFYQMKIAELKAEVEKGKRFREWAREKMIEDCLEWANHFSPDSPTNQADAVYEVADRLYEFDVNDKEKHP